VIKKIATCDVSDVLVC